jgi:hypothetical protein
MKFEGPDKLEAFQKENNKNDNKIMVEAMDRDSLDSRHMSIHLHQF